MVVTTRANGEMTIAQAALHLSVAQETVRRYIREGKLKAAKKKSVGLKKVWVIQREDLDAMLAE